MTLILELSKINCEGSLNRQVVIIDDEEDITSGLKYILEKNNFSVSCYSTAEAFFNSKVSYENCIYLVDWNLTGIKGVEIIKTIRFQDKLTTIFMISAYNQPETIVQGLKSGADDYITKPFNPEELVTKIENAFEKSKHYLNNSMDRGLKLLKEANAIMKEGKLVSLTYCEFVIFKHLYDKNNNPITREELLDQFDHNYVMTTRTIDVHIFSLRKKIEKLKIKITTVRNQGYQMNI
jgi:DNA-binding response OmpR family regulator